MNLQRRLSENFWLAEFVKSDKATRLGINNTQGLDAGVILNLTELCVSVLQPVRNHFKQVVTINSGYRCLALNRALKSADTSDHRTR